MDLYMNWCIHRKKFNIYLYVNENFWGKFLNGLELTYVDVVDFLCLPGVTGMHDSARHMSYSTFRGTRVLYDDSLLHKFIFSCQWYQVF